MCELGCVGGGEEGRFTKTGKSLIKGKISSFVPSVFGGKFLLAGKLPGNAENLARFLGFKPETSDWKPRNLATFSG